MTMNSTWFTFINDPDVNAPAYYNLTSSNVTLSIFSNSTYSHELNLSKIATITLICLVSFMTLITVTGNLLVIIAFICDPRIRTYSNCFILNLSIADLLVGLICIPLYAHKFIFDQWYLGYHLCKLWLVFDYVVGSASTLCIVVISYDRYQMVSKGLDYLSNISIQRALKFIFGTWIIALLNYGPAIILWDWLPGNDPYQHQTCDPPFAKHFPYLITTACVEFFVPFFSLITLNLLVYINIRRRSRGLIRTNTLKLQRNNQYRTFLTAHTPSVSDLRLTRKHSKASALVRDRRAAKNLFILVFAFVICWCPYTLLTLIRALCKHADKCIPALIYEITFWLLWFNSTLNPFLYSCLHVKFREAFYRILCFQNRKHRHPTRGNRA